MANEFTRDMLFGGKKTETENEKSRNKVIDIDVEDLINFREGQPFSYSDGDYQELKESIKVNGIYEPILVRQIEDNKYEIINGHNRVKCAKELGIQNVTAIVKHCPDDTKANYILLEMTLKQRKNIPPCEKGSAYKLQLELLKKMRSEKLDKDGNINDLEETVQSEQLDSIDELSSNSPDGRTTIQRLIRLTELIPELQEKVNNKQVPLLAGVELSYINVNEQDIINKFIEDNNYKLKVPQAERLRARKGEITADEIINILMNKKKKKKEPKFTGKIKKDTYTKYKDKFSNDDDFDILIDKLLSEYFENNE